MGSDGTGDQDFPKLMKELHEDTFLFGLDVTLLPSVALHHQFFNTPPSAGKLYHHVSICCYLVDVPGIPA